MRTCSGERRFHVDEMSSVDITWGNINEKKSPEAEAVDFFSCFPTRNLGV